MDSSCQLSQSTQLDGVPSFLEVHDCRSGNSGPAREQLVRKLLRFSPDLIQVFRIDHSFVLAASLVRRVQCSRVSQHRRIGAARPARRCLFSDEMDSPATICLRASKPTVLLVHMPPLGAQNLLSALDRIRLTSSSIVRRESQPGGFGNLDECLS